MSPTNFDLLSINQYTTKPQWNFRESVEGYAAKGVKGISVSHEKLAEVGAKEASRMLRDEGMQVTGYCIGGLLTDLDSELFLKRIDDNKKILDEAAAIEARCVVFVAGGLPEESKDIAGARTRCLEGLAELQLYARQAGVVLGLEPLHPMTCSLRSCLTTLGEANDWIDELGGGGELGVVVDVYHLWWDPELEKQIERSKGRIAAFHVSDWLADTRDIRLDRGMMGEGVIDIPRIRALVEATGYDGFREVEIFSERNWWKREPLEVVDIVKERYLEYV